MDGGDVPDETDEALSMFGLVAEDSEEEPDEPFRVYAINWPAFIVFCATCKKWRKVIIGERAYLDIMDWTEARAVAELYGIRRKKWPQLFGDLQVMKQTALDILSES